MKKTLLILITIVLFSGFYPSSTIKIALLKYRGGGDWYANPTALPNLIKFCNKNLKTSIDPNYATVDLSSDDIYSYPFVHMTGHGNVIFSDEEALTLRNYLIGGGFLHIDDNYGLDKFIRPQMKKVFPELDFVELPYDHKIYNQNYKFTQGPPKIHEHDGKRPQGFGLIWEDRLVCYYTYESDLGDGWEDPEVHNDSEPTRTKALRMGANIIQFAFTQ